ncbi:hypothetical protein MSG28_013879 [Choristoneura fumiferana]|uniref:Uncharacterized protein n=1 Tax=Choristoneura fumiferana TaxID=7141 RepID=A0ACC0K9V9_CHOFU|nr:hypothetical protein MSG28_013879 [Choristoneura fumiferana]
MTLAVTHDTAVTHDPPLLAEACLQELAGSRPSGTYGACAAPCSPSVSDGAKRPRSHDARLRTRVRAARAAVLSNIVAIAAGDSVGE